MEGFQFNTVMQRFGGAQKTFKSTNWCTDEANSMTTSYCSDICPNWVKGENTPGCWSSLNKPQPTVPSTASPTRRAVICVSPSRMTNNIH